MKSRPHQKQHAIEQLESRLLLSVTRPAYNTGTGFFVLNGKVYDADGNEFVMKGPNTVHAWGSYNTNYNTIDQIAKTGANAARVITYQDIASDSGNAWTDSADTPARRQVVAERYIADGMVVVMDDHASIADGASVETSKTALDEITAHWQQNYQWLQTYEKYVIVNIANEWGNPAGASDSNHTWRDAYIDEVSKLRNGADGIAGTGDDITNALMIDAGAWGQDYNTLRFDAAAVEAADPQHNVIFSIHLYGSWRDSNRSFEETPNNDYGPWDVSTALTQLHNAGLPLVVGEFASEDFKDFSSSSAPYGAYRTQQLLQTLDTLGVGWFGWSYNGSSPQSLNMLTNLNNTNYNTNTDLSSWGDTLVNDPNYGLKADAVRASIFSDPLPVMSNPPLPLPALPTSLPPSVRFILETTTIGIPEGSNGAVRVRLNAAPASNVTLTLGKTSGDNDLTLNTTSLIFTPTNWNQYQLIVLTAATDADTTVGSAKFSLSAPGFTNTDFTAKEIEPPALPAGNSFTVSPDRDRLYSGSGTAASVTVDSVFYTTNGNPQANGTMYMRFPLSSLRGKVSSATLRVFTTNATANRFVRVYAAYGDSWTESSTPSNTTPIYASYPLIPGSDNSGFALPTSGGAYMNISFTELANFVAQQYLGDGFVTLALRMVSSTASFQTREGANPPQLIINTTEAIPPQTTASAFVYNGAPQQLRFTFNDNVQASLDATDLILTNTSANTTIDTATIQLLNYDTGTNTATFSFPGQPNAVLPGGVYTATFNAAGVRDANSNAMIVNYSTRFLYAVGTSANDTITASLDDSSTVLQVWVNDTTDHDPTFSTPLAGLANFSVDGFDGDDTLTLNFESGDMRPAGANGFGWTLGTNNETLNLTGTTSWTFANDPATSGTPHLTLGLSSGAHAIISAAISHWNVLNVQDGGSASVSGALIVTNALTFAGTGTLDLNSSDMIVDYATGGPLAGAIIADIVSARAGAAWTGPGLTSTSAKNASPKITTLGAMEAVDYKSVVPGATTFDGQPIDNTAVLVKYTYYGDANFNGSVDGADYSHIDGSFNQEHSAGSIGGWMNGDFNGDGTIDGADYALIDSAFNGQTTVLRPAIGSALPPMKWPAKPKMLEQLM